MKEQFRKEEHNRQDKAKKADYGDVLRDTLAVSGTWTGLSDNPQQNKYRDPKQRERELESAKLLHFVYGKWLPQYTKKISHFARLNAAHSPADNPELPSAFEDCTKKWEKDYPKILVAIKNGYFVRVNLKFRGISGTVRLQDQFRWDFPQGLLAAEVSRRMPKRFVPPKAKGTGNGSRVAKLV
jgi:hypothetical protein